MEKNMKVAVLKLGARLVFGNKVGTSGGSGEAISLVDMLVKGGVTVHCYTKILDSDPIPSDDNLHMMNIESYFLNIENQNYDALVVVNGSVNFFGGAEDAAQILNYHIINNFKGPVVYLYCDPNLPLKQIWPSIEKKEWADNWKERDIKITRDIHVISQSYNLTKNKEIFEKNGYNVASIQQYDFQKFPMMRDRIPEPLLGRSVDISYGGTFRSGRREKKLIDFYFGYPEDISVEVFGKIKLDDFNPKKIEGLNPPKFTGAVDYSKMIPKMADAKYHIAIGDNQYPDFEMISQRVYEAIMAGTFVFIDKEFDKNKRIFGNNSYLSDLCYVSNRDEVIQKIRSMRDESLSALTKLQYAAVNFDEAKYCNDFVYMIKDTL
jgi:hypothetical protein